MGESERCMSRSSIVLELDSWTSWLLLSRRKMESTCKGGGKPPIPTQGSSRESPIHYVRPKEDGELDDER